MAAFVFIYSSELRENWEDFSNLYANFFKWYVRNFYWDSTGFFGLYEFERHFFEQLILFHFQNQTWTFRIFLNWGKLWANYHENGWIKPHSMMCTSPLVRTAQTISFHLADVLYKWQMQHVVSTRLIICSNSLQANNFHWRLEMLHSYAIEQIKNGAHISGFGWRKYRNKAHLAGFIFNQLVEMKYWFRK